MSGSTVVTPMVGSISSAVLSPDGRKLWTVMDTDNGGWFVQVTIKQQDGTWQDVEQLRTKGEILQPAIADAKNEIRNKFMDEDEYEDREHPMQILLCSHSGEAATISVCCVQSVHVWDGAGEYKVFIVPVTIAMAAVYDSKVYLAHAGGIFCVSISDGKKEHVAYDQLSSYLEEREYFVREIAIRRDGLFAITCGSSTVGPCILTGRLVGKQNLKFVSTNEIGGDYTSVQFCTSTNRPFDMVAIELIQRKDFAPAYFGGEGGTITDIYWKKNNKNQ